MYRLLLVPLLLLLTACPAASGPPPAAKKVAPLQLEATVVFVRQEGGFYGLVAADGRRFDPTNLPAALRQDGLKVRFSARPLPPSVGTHMWGRRIELIDIHPR